MCYELYMKRQTKPGSNFVLRRENPSNVFIEESDVLSILKKYDIGVPVQNMEHYRRAFVHRSYLKVESSNVVEEAVANCKVPLQDQCNERYELLGDCILSSVVGTYLFTRFEDQAEGFLTKTKTKIVRGKTLGKLSKRMGFGKWVIISLHVENEDGRENIRILEDLFECFIAALYLDNGGEPVSEDWFSNLEKLHSKKAELTAFQQSLNLGESSVPTTSVTALIKLVNEYCALSDLVLSTRSNGYLICQKFIMNVLEREIDLVKLIMLDDNYKDQLQHYYQKIFMGTFPEWEILDTQGPTNDRWHTIGVRDDRGMLIGTGTARKKIDAQQKASKNALKHLGVDVLSDSDGEDEYYMKQQNIDDGT